MESLNQRQSTEYKYIKKKKHKCKLNKINKPTYWNTFIEQIVNSLHGFLVFPVLLFFKFYFLYFAILNLKCVTIEIEYFIENIIYRIFYSFNFFLSASPHPSTFIYSNKMLQIVRKYEFYLSTFISKSILLTVNMYYLLQQNE